MKTDISIVMTVFNGQAYLRAAIDSLLRQTHKNFELIIVNDGSTDKTTDILASYNDPRIKIINQKNRGQVASMNRGIKAAESNFIARLDADDLADKSRLEKQYRFLKANKDFVLVGSQVYMIDQNSRVNGKQFFPLTDSEIRLEMLHRTAFVHSAVMFRKSTAIKAGLYRDSHALAEDYDLWLRLGKLGKLANLPEFLCYYRSHPESLSAKFTSQQSKISKLNTLTAWQHRIPRVQKISKLHRIYAKAPNNLNAQTPATTNLYLRSLLRSVKHHRPLLAAQLTAGLLKSKPARKQLMSLPFRQGVVRKQRVIFINDHKTPGGGEAYLKTIASNLGNFSSLILAPTGVQGKFNKLSFKKLDPPPLNIERLFRRKYRLQKIWYRLKYRYFFRDNPADLLSIQSLNYAFCEPFALSAKHNKIPILLTAHTRTNQLDPKTRLQIKALTKSANKIICVSEAVRQDMLALKVPPRKLVKIPHGVDTDRFRPGPLSQRDNILWLGRLEKADKNPMLFARIARLAHKNNLKYKFRIVGDGSQRRKLLRYKKKHNLTNLEIRPFCHDNYEQALYQQALLTVITSSTEALSLVALKSMSCGTPVIAPKEGGLTEIINNTNGVIVKEPSPANFLTKIDQILNDQDKLHTLRRNARKRIKQNFDETSFLKQTEKVYLELLGLGWIA